MNYFPFHIGDYAAHTRHLTLMEDLAYRRLLDWYYTHERHIPAVTQSVCRLIGMREHVAEVEAVLTEFFTKDEAGEWMHERCDAEIARAQAAAERARKNGKKGGRPREAGPVSAPAPRPPAPTSAAITQPVTGGNPQETKSKAPKTKTKTKEKTPPTPKGGAVGSGFERFWTAFPPSPRKAARLHCWNKWKAKNLDDHAEAIVAHVKAMASSEAWTKDGGQFIPAPLTYLNQARWEAPTEAQAAEAKQETNWRDSPAAVSKRGKALGLGEWSEALWVAGKVPDYPAYLRSVEKALAAQQPAEEPA